MSGAFIKDGFVYVPLFERGKPVDPATFQADVLKKEFFERTGAPEAKAVPYRSARRAQNRAWRAWAQLCRWRMPSRDYGPGPHWMCTQWGAPRRCMERLCPRPFRCTTCDAEIVGAACFVEEFKFGVGTRHCLCAACARKMQGGRG